MMSTPLLFVREFAPRGGIFYLDNAFYELTCITLLTLLFNIIYELSDSVLSHAMWC